ncbi:MAG: N-(5'-phosphoribosyl)anthranilate isomerase [Spirosomataceae bacterium]
MLKTFVKISNVTNLSDARYCAGMGVDMLGFVMDADSAEYVSPEKLKEIKSWLAGVQIIGETQSTDFAEIKSMVEAYDIDLLQITDASLINSLKELDKPLILKFDAESAYLKENLERYAQDATFVLLEGESLTDVFVHELQELSSNYEIVLGFGVNQENLAELLESLPNLKGIALKGSEEIRPGYKNYDELMEILEALEIE